MSVRTKINGKYPVAVFLTFVVLFACSWLSPAPSPTATENKSPATTNQKVEGVVDQSTTDTFEVVQVIDGDTIKAVVDGNTESIRLIGIDAPETSPQECKAQESTAALKNLVENENVTLEADPTQGDRDKYDRLLRFVLIDGKNVGLELISQGLATEYTYDKPYKYVTEFKVAQESAQQKEVGIWGADCDCKLEEVSRKCSACNKASVKYDGQYCDPVTKTETDKSCSNLCAAAAPAPAPKPLPPPPQASCLYSCSSPDRNCSDFSTHAQAVQFFHCCGFTVNNDPMQLDGLGVDDGDPCESLP